MVWPLDLANQPLYCSINYISTGIFLNAHVKSITDMGLVCFGHSFDLFVHAHTVSHRVDSRWVERNTDCGQCAQCVILYRRT